MGVVMERWCPTQQMLGVLLKEIVVKKLLVAGLLLLCVVPANAQSWGRGGAYTGAGSGQLAGTSSSATYYPRSGVHSCNWSVAASCAAWRNGSYERDGVKYQLVKKFPNGRWTNQVFHNGTRVK